MIVDRQVLAEALKPNRTLNCLNLAHSSISVEGVQARCSDWAGWCLSKDRAGGVDLVQLAFFAAALGKDCALLLGARGKEYDSLCERPFE